jgi:hypothetical protein
MSGLNSKSVTLLFNAFCRFEVKMEKKNGDFNAKECRAMIKNLFPKGNSAKKIYDITNM